MTLNGKILLLERAMWERPTRCLPSVGFMNRKWYPLLISLAIHASCSVSVESCHPGKQKPHGGSKHGDQEEGDEHDGKGLHVKIVNHMPPGMGLHDVCPHFFGGIGVTYDGPIVSVVYRGYLAEQLGIKVGDMIPQIGTLVGEVGSPIEFDVVRDGHTKHIKTKRVKICVEG